MATNMHIVYSKRIKGAGLIAGGVYSDTWKQNDHPNENKGMDAYEKVYEKNLLEEIDDPENMKTDPVYIFLLRADGRVGT